MSEKTTQVAVLGGGPAGYAAAFKCADLGLETTLIDLAPNPGGVCLYRGCIPSKALLHVSKLINEAAEAGNWGISFNKPEIDLDKLRAWMDSVIEQLTGGLGMLRNSRGIDHVQGRGTLKDANTIEVALGDGGTASITAEHIIVAVGSHPTPIPDISIDSERVLDSTSGLELPVIPGSLLVIGGGYIGLELGSVYASLGSEVSVVEMTDGLLPGADRDLVKVLQGRLSKMFKNIMFNTRVTKVEEAASGLEVHFDGETDETTQKYDYILVAVGRRPNSQDLGLENAGIEIDDRGFVTVDAQRRTNVPNIFAVGDIAGEPMLAHKGSHEGLVAAEVIAGERVAFEAEAIPAVVFTDPELAWCGLTETEAEAAGRKVNVTKFPWAASGRAISIDRPDGLTKILFDPETERVLGVGICGAGAGEMIAEGVLAVEMAALATDLKLSIHPHPTLSETVMEAAEMIGGASTHIYRPKKKQH